MIKVCTCQSWHYRNVYLRAPLPVTALAKKLSFPAILSQRSYANCSLINKYGAEVLSKFLEHYECSGPLSFVRAEWDTHFCAQTTKCVEQYLTVDGIWCFYKKLNHLNSDGWCLIPIALRRAISKKLNQQIFCIILSIQMATFCQYSKLPWSKLLIIHSVQGKQVYFLCLPW